MRNEVPNGTLSKLPGLPPIRENRIGIKLNVLEVGAYRGTDSLDPRMVQFGYVHFPENICLVVFIVRRAVRECICNR